LLYMLHVEQVRPDVELILQGVDQERPNVSFNPDYDAVYLAHDPQWGGTGLDVVPVGLAYRAIRAGTQPPEPSMPAPIEGEGDARVPKDFLTRSLIGNYYFMEAMSYETLDWPRARRGLERVLELVPDGDLSSHNVGLIYARNGWYEEGIAAYERCHAINPRGLLQREEPDRPGVVPPRVSCAREAENVRRERDRVRGVEQGLLSNPSFQGLISGSAAWERQLAERLEGLGETAAARRHRALATNTTP
ncbi:MAG: hypothetical protein ACSLFQ_17770, partial [Thermoanaerobaculia bacterium]